MVSFNIIDHNYFTDIASNESPKGKKVQEDLKKGYYYGEYKIDKDNKDYFIWKNDWNKAIVLVTAKIIIKDGKSDLVKDGYYFVLISDYKDILHIYDNNVIGYMMYNCLTIDYTDPNFKDKKDKLKTYSDKIFTSHKMHFDQIEHLDFLKVEIKFSEIQKHQRD